MQNIIVGVDAGSSSKVAARRAIEIAQAMGAHVHLVTAVRKRQVAKVASGSDHWLLDNVDEARDGVEAWLTEEGLDVPHTTTATTGTVRSALVNQARRVDADLIVVGSRDRHGIGRLTGSVGTDVSHHAPCSLLIVKTH